jgi:hypothetical protein
MSFYVMNKKQLCLLIYLWYLLVFLILNNDLGKEMEEVAQSDDLSSNVPATAEENHDKPQPVQSVLAKK